MPRVDFAQSQIHTQSMRYTFQQAQTNLAQLLDAAEEGNEVIIECDGRPALRLIVTEMPIKSAEERKPRVLGQYAGHVQYPDQLWKPLETDDELREYGFDVMIDDGKPDELLS